MFPSFSVLPPLFSGEGVNHCMLKLYVALQPFILVNTLHSGRVVHEALGSNTIIGHVCVSEASILGYRASPGVLAIINTVGMTFWSGEDYCCLQTLWATTSLPTFKEGERYPKMLRSLTREVHSARAPSLSQSHDEGCRWLLTVVDECMYHHSRPSLDRSVLAQAVALFRTS